MLSFLETVAGARVSFQNSGGSVDCSDLRFCVGCKAHSSHGMFLVLMQSFARQPSLWLKVVAAADLYLLTRT